MRLALAGDTMLGRKVAEAMTKAPPEEIVDDEVVEAVRTADLVVANLECCISDRGEPWPDPRKPFFFRAPPVAVRLLRHLGVDVVTLANNHALDFGEAALLDTFDHLDNAGIAHVGAGRSLEMACEPNVVDISGLRVGVVGITDHPADFAAGPDRPGIAFADLRREVPPWVTESVDAAAAVADVVIVTPHWGPNMTARPVPHVVSTAEALARTPATLVAGHSAHVFHGVATIPRNGEPDLPVLYDLGDFIDDYAVEPDLRNDLGLLWFVDFEDTRPVRVEALPLTLEYCHTRRAHGAEREWIRKRLTSACTRMGTQVIDDGTHLVIGL
jgi:poly-gamma-glutamate capsule biosynthesis protein CapA/YwtB (metallophosphatase superfamily)